MTDPHHIRMAAGQAAMLTVDALDDQTIALLEQAAEPLSEAATRLRNHGLTPLQVAGFMVSVVIGAALASGEQGEG